MCINWSMPLTHCTRTYPRPFASQNLIDNQLEIGQGKIHMYMHISAKGFGSPTTKKEKKKSQICPENLLLLQDICICT